MQWFTLSPKRGSRGYDALAKDVVNSCVMWKGKQDKQGYGRVRFLLPDGRIVERAHRFVFYQTYGILPKGCVVKHRCDNVACVEPSHLILGLPSSNALDSVARAKHWYRLLPSEFSKLRQKHAA